MKAARVYSTRRALQRRAGLGYYINHAAGTGMRAGRSQFADRLARVIFHPGAVFMQRRSAGETLLISLKSDAGAAREVAPDR